MAIKQPLKGLKIVLDIDGTVFYHRYPKLGDPLPGWEYIKGWVDDGAILNISTMRSNVALTQALDGLDKLGIPYAGVSKDTGQEKWTSSPKCYGHIIVDDTCCGIPLGIDSHGRDFVLLDQVDKLIRNKFSNKM